MDWPVGTRDGYDVSPKNSEDTVRSAFGAMALSALADVAAWLGKTSPAARYGSMAGATRAALARHNLRRNGSEAYFVDGAVGASADHAAVHSTLFAAAAGAADGDSVVADALAAWLRRHGVAPSSCMMGRWWVTAALRLGAWSPSAADLALEVLTAPGYPSWLDMMTQGATTTMEAWRPEDKSNLDWAHPWCASPSFTIPGALLGAAPLAPGWARWRFAPQPSSVEAIDAIVPTPTGALALSWRGAAGGNASVTLRVLPGQAASVCLPRPGAAAASGGGGGGGSDILFVDGVPDAAAAPWGRLLCTGADLAPGAHEVTRVPGAGRPRK